MNDPAGAAPMIAPLRLLRARVTRLVPVPGWISGPVRLRLGLLVLGLCAGLLPGPARGDAIVTTNSTAVLLGALREGGTIRLTFTSTLTLETPLIITRDTVLEPEPNSGRTVTFSGGGLYRLFHVLPGVRLQLRNLVLRDGLSTNGGAVLNEGFLSASNVVFTASKAVGRAGTAGKDGTVEFGFGSTGDDGGAGTDAAGGALLNLGEAVFEKCTFTSNSATGGAGGAGGKGGVGRLRVGRGGSGGVGASAYGGAISSRGSLQLLLCTFDANSALGAAGGAGGSNGSVQRAGTGGRGGDGVGGAIHSAGLLSLARSSFVTNLASGGAAAAAGAPFQNFGEDGERGGGAFGGAIATWSTGQVVNATFYTNLVVGGRGGDGAAGTFTLGNGGRGGFAIGAGLHARGVLSVTNATLAWNSGTNGAGGAAGGTFFSQAGDPGRLAGSGIGAESGASVLVVNSILAARGFTTVDGPVTDKGHNLFSDGGTGSRVTGSRYFSDPVLSGYQIWTSGPAGLLPLTGSPAEGAADADSAPPIDQRGIARPLGSGSDIGAMEVGVVSFFVSGYVLDGDLGVVGVPLTVGTNAVVTDADGWFRAGPLASGFYNVRITTGAEGYTPSVVQAAVFADVTDVLFQTLRPVLTLVHSAVSGGDVLTLTGVPGRVYWLEGSPDLNAWVRLQSATTDATGRAAFTQQPGQVERWFYRAVRP